MAGACSWVFIACAGAQVRSTPGPEDCPPGAVETMEKELRLPLAEQYGVNILPGGDFNDRATVRAGFGSVELAAPYGELPEGTMLLGDFILGEKRLYGRFKQAQTPGGATYPVCMELETDALGVPIEANTGPDTARVRSRVAARTVSSFE